MSSALGPTRRDVNQAVSPSHTGWTMRVRGRPSGPTVARSHQIMRWARSTNSGSISVKDETRIDDSSELEPSRARIQRVSQAVTERRLDDYQWARSGLMSARTR